MTDRHVVNKSFVGLFEDLRQENFSQNIPEFEKMSKVNKDNLVKVHGLYCGLHVLANMGTVAKESLKVFEQIALVSGQKITDLSFNKGNARSFDLVFEISQALTPTGNQSSGCASNWSDYLNSIDIDKSYIVSSFLHH